MSATVYQNTRDKRNEAPSPVYSSPRALPKVWALSLGDQRSISRIKKKYISFLGLITAGHLVWLSDFRATHHNGDIVPPVARQGAVQLEQGMLGFEKTAEVRRVQGHHHGEVVHATQRKKRLDKRVLIRPFFQHLQRGQNALRQQKVIKSEPEALSRRNKTHLFYLDEGTWTGRQSSWKFDALFLQTGNYTVVYKA